MNDEMQWRRQMRTLAGAVEPAHDLWPGVHASLKFRAASRRSSGVKQWLAVAASLVMATTATFTAYRFNTRDAANDTREVTFAHAALDWATPADPALAHAADDLSNATGQLEQALEKRPDAVFLVGLLNRTNSQRMRLLRQNAYAG